MCFESKIVNLPPDENIRKGSQPSRIKVQNTRLNTTALLSNLGVESGTKSRSQTSLQIL